MYNPLDLANISNIIKWQNWWWCIGGGFKSWHSQPKCGAYGNPKQRHPTASGGGLLLLRLHNFALLQILNKTNKCDARIPAQPNLSTTQTKPTICQASTQPKSQNHNLYFFLPQSIPDWSATYRRQMAPNRAATWRTLTRRAKSIYGLPEWD